MTLRFGTDGVRGPADALTDELAAALGTAAAVVLGGGADRFLIGRDTRASGDRLEAALAAGVAAGGLRAEVLGVVPTPTVAWVSAARDAPGAVISASHNPWTDNGIKFFAAGGRKLPDAVEDRLEAELDAQLGGGAAPVVSDPAAVRRPVEEAGADLGAWTDAVVATAEGRSLDGLAVVIDCANGAASELAPEVLRRLGADLTVLHADPDGTNINDACGSTHPGDLQRAVVERGAAAGLALDGDADRLLAVDELGRLVDGDHLLALFALDLRGRGRLRDDLVVTTVMTNLGFRLAMDAARIAVVETPVGDRHVLEALARGGWSLGGEQSGHIVFADLATTGDGILSGVQVLDLLRRSDRPLSALSDGAMTSLPQVLHNVRVAHRRPDIAEVLATQIEAEERKLGPTGRVLIRPSGTEPLVRVMVEAPEVALAEEVASRLAASVDLACGRGAPPEGSISRPDLPS